MSELSHPLVFAEEYKNATLKCVVSHFIVLFSPLTSAWQWIVSLPLNAAFGIFVCMFDHKMWISSYVREFNLLAACFLEMLKIIQIAR